MAVSELQSKAISRYEEKGVTKVRKLMQLDRKYTSAPNAQDALTCDLNALLNVVQTCGRDQLNDGDSRLLITMGHTVSTVLGYQYLRSVDPSEQFGEFYYRQELIRSLRHVMGFRQTNFDMYGDSMRQINAPELVFGIPHGVQIDANGKVTFYDFYTGIQTDQSTDVALRCVTLRNTATNPKAIQEICTMVKVMRQQEQMRRQRYNKAPESYARHLRLSPQILHGVSVQNDAQSAREFEGPEYYDTFTGMNIPADTNHELVISTLRKLSQGK